MKHIAPLHNTIHHHRKALEMTRHTTRFDLVANIAGADDWYSPGETARSLFFDIASVLDMSDVEGNVTPQPFAQWGYHRAPFTVPSIETVAARGDNFNEGEWTDDYSYAQVNLAMAIRDGSLTQSDLIYAGNVLDHYTNLLRLAGRDY